MMSYVDPSIKDKFETLSIDLKNAILERDVRLNNLNDLIKVLEDIVAEGS
ncbi:MAG TPA: molecular chaperone GroEL [Ruminococcaceae bacterium]|nr:molecular chaperone GroEL [Oscillospiraceae bacterium]